MSTIRLQYLEFILLITYNKIVEFTLLIRAVQNNKINNSALAI